MLTNANSDDHHQDLNYIDAAMDRALYRRATSGADYILLAAKQLTSDVTSQEKS